MKDFQYFRNQGFNAKCAAILTIQSALKGDLNHAGVHLYTKVDKLGIGTGELNISIGDLNYKVEVPVSVEWGYKGEAVGCDYVTRYKPCGGRAQLNPQLLSSAINSIGLRNSIVFTITLDGETNPNLAAIGLHFDTFDLAVTGKGQVRKLFRIGQSVCLHDTVRFGFPGSRAADGEYE